ncbi:hypothetical protein D9611_005982 [Ephemerocybe angulata]|uniref:Uncharacterized protein n=1 Tax=Ephemerocybe angulata TaxID=980116 RepID=A0A8H5FLJ8_9AGAR|nr:hypothetical protein D9611_005982 [Tulosesus angulatus]
MLNEEGNTSTPASTTGHTPPTTRHPTSESRSCSTLCDVALPLLPSSDIYRRAILNKHLQASPVDSHRAQRPTTPGRQREHWRAPDRHHDTKSIANAYAIASTNSTLHVEQPRQDEYSSARSYPRSRQARHPSPVSLSRAGLVVKTDLVTPSFGLRPSFGTGSMISDSRGPPQCSKRSVQIGVGGAHSGRSLAVDVNGPKFAVVAARSSHCRPSVVLRFCRTVRRRELPTAANGAVGCANGDGDGTESRASRSANAARGWWGLAHGVRVVNGRWSLCLEREGLRSATDCCTHPTHPTSNFFLTSSSRCTRRVMKGASSRIYLELRRRIAARSEGGRVANASAGPGVLSRLKVTNYVVHVARAQCLRMRAEPVWVSTSGAPIEPPNSAVLVARLAVVVCDSRR